MQDLRDIGDEGPGHTFPYNFIFPWHEQNVTLGKEATIELSIAIATVFIVVLFLLADAISVVLVMTMVGITVISQIALFHFCGEEIECGDLINQ